MSSLSSSPLPAARSTRSARGRRHLKRRVGFLLTVPGLIGLTGFSGSDAAAKQALEPESSYVVLMAEEPVVAYEGDEPGLEATALDSGEKLDDGDPAVREYVDHLEEAQQDVIDDADLDADDVGDSYTYVLNGFEADLTESEVAQIERRPDVAKVVPNELSQLQTDASGEFLGLDDRRGAWKSGYVGEDVVIGVIDSGIWPEHASFADDGSYAPLADYAGLPCEFGDTAYNPDDASFECNDKLLGARDMRLAYKSVIGPETFNSARDYDGHGTHTASTAAGNADVDASLFGIDRGIVSGVAPRARVIAYSVCGNLGCFTSDLAGAIDTAVADGVDVINYSIGGGASLTDPADIAFLFAADANVWVATSAGNSGPAPETMGGPATVPWITSVGASTHDRTYNNVVRLGNGQLATGASVTPATDGTKPLVDAAALGNELCDPAVPFTGDVTDKIVICLRGVFARVDKGLAVANAGGAGMVLYNPNDAQALVTDSHFLPAIHVNFTTGSAIKAYAAAAGGAATASLTAGQARPTQGSVMADFSSRGANPISADIIKPDVTAPGVNILAGNTPFPSSGASGQLFQSISGTSMSSPHVAGLYALMRQAHPDWTAAMAKSALMTTARQDVVKEDGTTAADPFDMGAGHVDPSGRPTSRNSIFNPGLVYDAGLFDYLAFLCGTDDSIFIDPASTCGQLVAAGESTAASDLNLASIGAGAVAGSVTVTRTVTSVADRTLTFRPTVEDPPGFDVTVSERKIRLAPGESATFDVTITSVDAPVGEWAFGSLTWKSGQYRARSPIAVRASALDVADSVSGSGTDGSVEFPVGFGYTGAYTAAPHGPAAEVVLAGTVSQDPDQTFDPSDPAGTVAFPIVTSGSAFLRIALGLDGLAVPNPDVDLDLYLVDSVGNVVASSTAGGTSELIEAVLPPDDSWTLYVHGWQTAGGDVEFGVSTWDVPATPSTGELEITSAPTEAVVDTTGTIVASWSGLDNGAYIGAVSHSDGSGLLGLTLVEIGVDDAPDPGGGEGAGEGADTTQSDKVDVPKDTGSTT
ncbi:S8 family peptidase [Ilumatobacter coccineus]|uniref:Peptidase S08 family protein n=1 Tax=Ilumatobacter coccineus (strain NBRC 103263 / KCTC 29153 / YM16-304) TaxID=1313172 RepID=A0A6C7DZQ1_ILUCY|nr:S8 family serine peptidase [Ilumatobacter coccineus]BAN00350.1 peptidase S08 family protein [Ilumatobacter coccineus YM16-304]